MSVSLLDTLLIFVSLGCDIFIINFIDIFNDIFVDIFDIFDNENIGYISDKYQWYIIFYLYHANPVHWCLGRSNPGCSVVLLILIFYEGCKGRNGFWESWSQAQRFLRKPACSGPRIISTIWEIRNSASRSRSFKHTPSSEIGQ